MVSMFPDNEIVSMEYVSHRLTVEKKVPVTFKITIPEMGYLDDDSQPNAPVFNKLEIYDFLYYLTLNRSKKARD